MRVADILGDMRLADSSGLRLCDIMRDVVPPPVPISRIDEAAPAYHLVWSDNSVGLSQEVTRYLRAGWVVSGESHVTWQVDRWIFWQAVLKPHVPAVPAEMLNSWITRCWRCGDTGPVIDEFTSPHTGLCARCTAAQESEV
jgi:hypothetical protein